MTTDKIHAQLCDASGIIDNAIEEMDNFPTIDKLETRIEELECEIDEKFSLVLHAGTNDVTRIDKNGHIISTFGFNIGDEFKEKELSIEDLLRLRRGIEDALIMRGCKLL